MAESIGGAGNPREVPSDTRPLLGSIAIGVVVVSAAASASDRQATTAGSGTGRGIDTAVFVSKGRLLN